MPAASKHPFSRPVLVASLPDKGLRTTVEANAEEREALAAADGIVAVDRLVATFDLDPRPAGQGVHVRGAIAAAIVQTCSVSLEPFSSELNETVDLVFMLPDAVEAWHRRHGVAAGEDADGPDEDPPDLIENGRIDLGWIAAEFLALGLDPYPRKPGVAFEVGRDSADATPSPFAGLARLTKAE